MGTESFWGYYRTSAMIAVYGQCRKILLYQPKQIKCCFETFLLTFIVFRVFLATNLVLISCNIKPFLLLLYTLSRNDLAYNCLIVEIFVSLKNEECLNFECNNGCAQKTKLFSDR